MSSIQINVLKREAKIRNYFCSLINEIISVGCNNIILLKIL